MKILDVRAIEGMDSRGMPTVLCGVTTERGKFRAAVPAGASVGKYEAQELRDGEIRLRGKGVRKAVNNVNTVLCEKLCGGREFARMEEIDELLIGMDHTPNKGVIGANGMLAVSMACARAYAAERGAELFAIFRKDPVLPCPMLNLLNGGAHAENNVDIQEFMILPTGARDFPEAMDMAREVYFCLKELLKAEGISTGVGDEGGFAPDLRNDEQALEYLMKAVRKAGAEREIAFALDMAASEWFSQGIYRLPKSGKEYTKEALIKYYRTLMRDYPIVSIEDGMGEDDAEGFCEMKRELEIQIVGDDLFVTNAERIRTLAECATAVLVKPNQIGTVTETLTAMTAAEQEGCACILSHRSGDTEDAFIADLAVGTGCGLVKMGAPCRGERTAKYNRFLEISDILGKNVRYAGKNALKFPKKG